MGRAHGGASMTTKKTRTEEDLMAELLEAIEQLLELEREELTS